MRISDLDTPAVLIDTNVMERNLKRLAGYCAEHGLSLRPHTKTHKIPELAKKQVAYGAVGITVAKLGQAEIMADEGLGDILIAYPVVGEPKLRRLLDLAARVKIRVALDSLEVAKGISDRAKSVGSTVGVLVEFDTGTSRCGLPIERPSLDIVQRIRELPGLDLCGILVYPGHFLVSPADRERLLVRENETLGALLDLLQTAGIRPTTVSGGSTPAAYMSHRFHGVTEIRSGTYIFNDMNTVGCEAASIEDCAVTVLATVVSTSVRGRAIIDGGSKTFSSDRWLSGSKQGCGRVLEDPDTFFEGMSEEHGHLDISRARLPFRVGERLRVIPNHVCTTLNMHDTVYGVDEDMVVAQWAVQGRGKVR